MANSLFRTPSFLPTAPQPPRRQPFETPQQENEGRRYRAQFPVEPFQKIPTPVAAGSPAPGGMTEEALAGRPRTVTQPIPDRIAQMGQAATAPPTGGVVDVAPAASTRPRYADPIMQGRLDARNGVSDRPGWKERLKSGLLTAATAAGQIGAQSGGNLAAMAGAGIAGMVGGAWQPGAAAEYRFDANDAPRILQDQARVQSEQDRLMGRARQEQQMDLDERQMRVSEQNADTQADRMLSYAENLRNQMEIRRQQLDIDAEKIANAQWRMTPIVGKDGKAYTERVNIVTGERQVVGADGKLATSLQIANTNNQARRDLRQMIDANNIAVQQMRNARKTGGRSKSGGPAKVFPKTRLDEYIDTRHGGNVEAAMSELQSKGYTIK